MTDFDDLRDRLDDVEDRLTDGDDARPPELSAEEKAALDELFDVDPRAETSPAKREALDELMQLPRMDAS